MGTGGRGTPYGVWLTPVGAGTPDLRAELVGAEPETRSSGNWNAATGDLSDPTNIRI